PIWTGDIVDFDTKTESTGRSSVTVKVEVFAERYATGDRVAVTEATVKMVAVSAAGKSIDFRDPPTVGAAVRPERTG
ncbi:MAG: hypothetical protein ACO4BU_06480, partial [Phycisphaerales bacterium]